MLLPVYGCGLNCMSHDGGKNAELTAKFEQLLMVADNTGFDFRMKFAREEPYCLGPKKTTEA